jgi:hypothetical protein
MANVKVSELFKVHIDNWHGGKINIPEELYRDEEVSFYVGFASCFHIFVKQFPQYSDEKKLGDAIRVLGDEINAFIAKTNEKIRVQKVSRKNFME